MPLRKVFWACLLALIILGGCNNNPVTPPTETEFVVRLDPYWGVTVYPEAWGDTSVPLAAMAVDTHGNVLASEPSDFIWHGSAQVDSNGIFHITTGMSFGLYLGWVEYKGKMSNVVEIRSLPGAPPSQAYYRISSGMEGQIRKPESSSSMKELNPGHIMSG